LKIEETVKKIVETIEKQVTEEKLKECEDLYNAIVEILQQKKASAYNAYFALELAKWQIMYGFYAKIIGAAKPEELTIKKQQ